ncbi:hypothetical protein [Yersinia aleksiciae]|uniref:hypothetical protein n=1 Tax=Yersinia aleksiciae TaxID=263819 RepID=UPI0011A1DE4F|nr:hypothetical protein [Yersinia aleksiciae]
MSNEQDIYQKIAQILINAGPDKAKKIILRAEPFLEGDGCKYEFDYVDAAGNLDWFDPDGRAMRDLTKLIVELRTYYVENNLTNGRPAWRGCEVTLDVERVKLGIEFRYED